MAERAGYADPAYAEALTHIGVRRELTRSGGSLLVRDIPGSACSDATGPYPVFACSDWERLPDDLAELEGALVSVVLVPDPFGAPSPSDLASWFPDRCVPFKEHRVVDLSRPPLETASRHHRRDAARALRRSEVELVDDVASFLDDWTALYATLVARHDIEGPAAFPRESFARQFAVPGLSAFRALQGDELVGAALWFESAGVAYYHLAAYSDAGYECGAAYGLVATALEHFAGRGLEWASLGAGAGTDGGAPSGLARFKEGWSTATRTAYLCGRILDGRAYAELARSPAAYFPEYRAPRG